MTDETITRTEIANFLLTADREDLFAYLTDAVADGGERVLDNLQHALTSMREAIDASK